MDPYRAHGDCNRCVADSRFASCPSGTWCTCCKSPCTAPALFPARVGESVAPVSPWSSALAGAQKTTSTIKRLSFHYRAVPRRLILFPSLFFHFFSPLWKETSNRAISSIRAFAREKLKLRLLILIVKSCLTCLSYFSINIYLSWNIYHSI
mgnify:CR=1 FL=1